MKNRQNTYWQAVFPSPSQRQITYSPQNGPGTVSLACPIVFCEISFERFMSCRLNSKVALSRVAIMFTKNKNFTRGSSRGLTIVVLVLSMYGIGCVAALSIGISYSFRMQSWEETPATIVRATEKRLLDPNVDKYIDDVKYEYRYNNRKYTSI
jgi:hypothetical protein